jgi:succinate dehydrogenase/fumarate reductase-like Fe-S protein
MKDNVKVRCYRFDRSKNKEGQFDEYNVPVEGEISVQDLLIYIYENLDPTLSFFKHAACKQGVCGRCTLKINGKNQLACITPVEGNLTIEPVHKNKVIKDLLSN